MKTLLSATAVFICSLQLLFAQTDEDALRYSQTQLFGTARGMGVGDAFGAVGADVTSLSINPAGISMYKNNEMSITPGLSFVKTSTAFAGETNVSHKYNFNVSSAGLVFTWNKDPKVLTNHSKWLRFNLGFAANRIANFHNDIYYSGFNNSNSLLNNYLQSIPGGITPANLAQNYPFDLSLAYQTGLIRYNSGNNSYYSPLMNGGLEQSKTQTTRGGITEYSITFGGNYDDKLLLGIGVGIPALRYLSESTYTETDTRDSIPDFNHFDYKSTLRTTGVGVNARVGVIYKVNDMFRFGVSAQTPTYYSLADHYRNEMIADYNSGVYDTLSPSGSFNYTLVTPYKLTGSAAVIFKQHGFISADYEWQDYSSANFNFNSNASTGDKKFEARQNGLISAKYTGSGTLRIGGELALDIFRLRAGYSLGMSPFASGKGVSGFDNTRQSFGGGFGFVQDNFFLDFGYIHSLIHTFEQPYTLPGSDVPGANMTTNSNHFVLTLGAKF